MSGNNQLIPFFAILLLTVCYISIDTKHKISTSNNHLLIYLIIIGIILFLIMRDVSNINNEGFTAPLSYELKSKCPTNEKDHKLRRQVHIASPPGDYFNLTQDQTSYSFPTVDGQEHSPGYLSTFALNEAKPECCPSTYSTSTGCICRNNIQDRFIQSRGGNRTTSNTSEI